MELSYLERKVVTVDDMCRAIDNVCLEEARAEKRIRNSQEYSEAERELKLKEMMETSQIVKAAMRRVLDEMTGRIVVCSHQVEAPER